MNEQDVVGGCYVLLFVSMFFCHNEQEVEGMERWPSKS